MTLNPYIKEIEVYYDGKCGMCCTFHEWINKQERANAICFLPYQGRAALEAFPELNTLDPAREMVVRTNEGEIYRAAEAWLWCLWSCTKYRDLAKKFSNPKLLPHVQKLCHLLAANRITLSKIFFRKKNKEVAAEIHTMPDVVCEDDSCVLN